MKTDFDRPVDLIIDHQTAARLMARGRQQRAHEQLIPREVFEADEAWRHARRARGDDADNLTVGGDDGEANRDNGGLIVQVSQGNDDLTDQKANEETIKDMIEAIIRRYTTSMFRCVLMFSK